MVLKLLSLRPNLLPSGLPDYLNKFGVKSTYFTNGLNFKNYDAENPIRSIYKLLDVVKRAYDPEHQICSHIRPPIDY
ncbi:hypothetical protein K493DRAFT_235907 [Basidiobolus meristosporus CBS 931.73]|uniref:Uncharacterized protein n=1 Tax=Basidiobolus meristosporus CBS 931.73 TaxID=1314790 RepID=A0A1Y1XSG5_9FUNG|nr:hypothetical protein K493DRAFT_235907 [Basidiobolus meristosporus CBS 931.73]|eukprot:ORX88680.1 hypothetical protein K493DRAFT_235907 [Basidiobolus meristosporus CBS 931.73]